MRKRTEKDPKFCTFLHFHPIISNPPPPILNSTSPSHPTNPPRLSGLLMSSSTRASSCPSTTLLTSPCYIPCSFPLSADPPSPLAPPPPPSKALFEIKQNKVVFWIAHIACTIDVQYGCHNAYKFYCSRSHCNAQ